MLERSSHILEALELPQSICAADAQRGLEVAALLGPEVDLDEWRCVCEMLGLSAHEDLVTRLAERGMVERGDGAWEFPNHAIRRQIIDETERAGRVREHHAACARALFVLHSDDTSGVAARRATHLYKAGRHEEALAPTLIAAKEVFDRGDFDKAREFLDLHSQLLDELDVGADDPQRAQNAWRRGWVHHTVGNLEQARALAERSRQVLERTDWADECGHAALLHGRLCRDEGKFKAAHRCFDEAVSHFALAGDDHGLSTSRASRGFTELKIGEYKQARDSFTRALAAFEALDDRYMVASLLNFIAQTWLVEGRNAKALACVERARRVAKESGHKPNEAGAWIIHGEIARRARDWEEAKRCYAAAAKLYEADNRSVYVTRFNLALAEVGARNFDAAMEILEELERRYPEVGFSSRLPLVYAGMMACAAGVADWQGFSRYHTRTVEAVDKYGAGHDDIVWMAKEAVALAREHGNRGAQQRSIEVACVQLERMGEHEQAARLRASS